MGLHTGEAVERDRNYFGSEVNRTARLMALGHGGQILVSDTTAVMLRSRLTLRALGEHVLRGLRGRIAVFQVVADGLPTEFPVLRSVDYFAGNLPRQLSSLVGREQLVSDVAELVRSNRLVTLCGVGGVGKTRLSVEVGAELASEFPDGVWVVELAAVGDGSAIAGGDRHGDGHHAAGRRAAARHRRRGPGRPANAAAPRQLRARPGRRDARRRGDAGPRREPQDRGNVTRAARPRRGDRRDREPAHRGRRDRRPTPSPCSSIGPVPSDPTSRSRTRPTPRR